MATERSLAEVFLAAAGAPPGATSPELQEILGAHVAAGRAAWPEISLDESVFLSLLAEKTRGEARPERALAALRASELFLTCACAQADPRAIAAFEARYLAKADPALARLGLSPEKIDEAKQVLRRRLFVAEEEDKAPLIRQYSGRGPLQAWVTVAATRRALNLLRDADREVPVEDGALEALAPAGEDPELHYLKERYRADFRDALREGFASLSTREKHVLQLHYAEGLTTREIGGLYRVHQTTAAKWVSGAAASLLAATKRALRQRLTLDAAECESILRLVRSRLDLTLRGLWVKDRG